MVIQRPSRRVILCVNLFCNTCKSSTGLIPNDSRLQDLNNSSLRSDVFVTKDTWKDAVLSIAGDVLNYYGASIGCSKLLMGSNGGEFNVGWFLIAL